MLGISVRAAKETQESNVYKLACKTAEKLNCSGIVERKDVIANDEYVGEGYGIPNADHVEAIKMFANLEGILLDPVYSAKGAAGLIDLVQKGYFKKEQKIVFVHTGGSVALFGYDAIF